MLAWNESIWFSFFAGAALKSSAVLALAWLFAALLRGRSAALRHLIWTAAAGAVLVLPFLSVSLPAWQVPAALLPAGSNLVFHSTASAQPASGAAASAVPAAAGGSLQPVSWRPHWTTWVLLLWALGVTAVLLRTVLAVRAIRRLRRSARSCWDPELCEALSRKLGIDGAVDVFETETDCIPMAVGILRSSIILPAGATEWSMERRRAVLLHELAHVRRGDLTTHLLARVALTLYWWNPLAWLAWREFLKERERATDDLVLNAGMRASEYANHLLEVARSLQWSPAIGWAAVAMARRSQLEGRLLAILDSRTNRYAAGRASALVAGLAAIALVVPLAAVRAQETPQHSIPADVDATIRAAISQQHADILETSAQAAVEARQFDIAQKLLDSALSIRANASGSQSPEYGVDLIKLGDLATRMHNGPSALGFYQKAAQTLGDRPEAGRPLMKLASAAIFKKNFTQASEYLDHAQRVDPSQAGMVLMWKAVSAQTQKNVDEAEKLYRLALVTQDSKTPQWITIHTVFATFLREQGREADLPAVDALAAEVSRPATSMPSGVYKIGGSVLPPKVLSKVEPEYTDEARAAKLAGTSVVLVEIGPDGLAHNARILRPLGLGLDENGIDAITQWRFQPGTKDGQPVPVQATIEINFRLL